MKDVLKKFEGELVQMKNNQINSNMQMNNNAQINQTQINKSPLTNLNTKLRGLKLPLSTTSESNYLNNSIQKNISESIKNQIHGKPYVNEMNETFQSDFSLDDKKKLYFSNPTRNKCAFIPNLNLNMVK